LRQGVAAGLASSTDVSKGNQDAIAQADTVLSKITDILPTINGLNTGLASLASKIPGTPQYNLSAQLDTIKSNVGFAALQAMRAASPTGGALGQVSEQENRLLQSTLASLDQGQSADQLKANLAKVQQHFENLKKILNAPINAQVSYDDAGNVTIAGSSSGSTSSSSSGIGDSWDNL
jgi:DNA-binding CsgD family transcriptional regulator